MPNFVPLLTHCDTTSNKSYIKNIISIDRQQISTTKSILCLCTPHNQPYLLVRTSCTTSWSISAFHCVRATNQISSRFGFRQGLRQRSVNREVLVPRMFRGPNTRPMTAGLVSYHCLSRDCTAQRYDLRLEMPVLRLHRLRRSCADASSLSPIFLGYV